LERIFRILGLLEDMAADAHDQRSMAAHQDGKGQLIVVGGEGAQQLEVGSFLAVLGGDQLPDVPEHRAELCLGHVLGSPNRCVLLYSSRRMENLRAFFSVAIGTPE
jgi:hypothetical protein